MGDGQSWWAEQQEEARLRAEAERVAAGGKTDKQIQEERRRKAVDELREQLLEKHRSLMAEGLSETEAVLHLLAEHIRRPRAPSYF